MDVCLGFLELSIALAMSWVNEGEERMEGRGIFGVLEAVVVGSASFGSLQA